MGGACRRRLPVGTERKRQKTVRRWMTHTNFFCGNPARGSPFPLPRGVYLTLVYWCMEGMMEGASRGCGA